MTISENLLRDGTPWWLIEPPNSQKHWVVLWLYGFTSSAGRHQEGCVRMANKSNIAFAMVDYTGHGIHPNPIEEATRKQQYEEVCAVYDELVKAGYTKIIIIGGSFGGYMTALVSGAKQPEAVVLRAPANYPDEEWETPFSETGAYLNRDVKYRAEYKESSTNSAVESLSKFNGKTWVIEHELDEIIPATIPDSYFRVAKNRKFIMLQGIGHSFGAIPDAKKIRYISSNEGRVAEIISEVVGS